MYKTILVGDTNTGKSNLLFWILKNRKREDNYPTVGIEVGTKSFELRNNTNMNVQFWDTAGQERFRSVCLQHYRGAKGALLLFDITNRQSFNNLGLWLRQIRQNVENENVVICLLGNKLDRRSSREVSRQEAQTFVKDNDLAFYQEVSAQTGENVDRTMQTFLQIFDKQFSSRQPIAFAPQNGIGTGIFPEDITNGMRMLIDDATPI